MHTRVSVLHLQTGKENSSFSVVKELWWRFERKSEIARAEKSLSHSLQLAFLISGYKRNFFLMSQNFLQTLKIFCERRSPILSGSGGQYIDKKCKLFKILYNNTRGTSQCDMKTQYYNKIFDNTTNNKNA